MAIEGVLTRQKCAGKWCATLWDPVPQFSVTGNCEIFNFHDLGNSWKVTSSPNTSKLVLGPPKGSQWGAPRVPSHGIPWAPMGSPPMGGPGPPPMGSHGLPRVPSPMGPLPWDPFGLPRVPPMGSHPIPFRFPPLHPIVRRARHSPARKVENTVCEKWKNCNLG